MGSWQRHMKLEDTTPKMGVKPNSHSNAFSGVSGSYLSNVYSGSPGRISRYAQYDLMESDPEIATGLDIIADFCSQNLKEDDFVPVNLRFNSSSTRIEIETFESKLTDWVHLNDMDVRSFYWFRTLAKYGDLFFIRDPETFELYDVDVFNVENAIVDPNKGKEILAYSIRNVDLNVANKTAVRIDGSLTNYNMPGVGMINGWSGTQNNTNYAANIADANGTAGNVEATTTLVDAKHVIHIALGSIHSSQSWPFGESILNNVFKTYKQKELLEDALLIYRIQRAPERRVFKIFTGQMNAQKASAVLERVKNEQYQQRLPVSGNNGQPFTMMDASYNPMSIQEDFYFSMDEDGHGSTVETLPGGNNLDSIDDLKNWNNKLIRAMKIPVSYLPTGPGDGSQSFTDGKPGQVLVQELRFNKYCQRIQRVVGKQLDIEFKVYLKQKNYQFDADIFDVVFNAPMNFAEYTMNELLSSKINNFTQLENIPYISKRFALQEFLKLTPAQIKENERMVLEENADKSKKTTHGVSGGFDDGMGMSSVGITPDDLQGDEFDGEQDTGDTSMGIDTPEEPEPSEEPTEGEL